MSVSLPNFSPHYQLLTFVLVVPFAPSAPYSPELSSQPRILGPAATVLFAPKDPDAETAFKAHAPTPNIPKDVHYVDLAKSDHVMVLSQPEGQTCAVLGGIMALRMKVRGASGVVVGGRVRDLSELRKLQFPVSMKASAL